MFIELSILGVRLEGSRREAIFVENGVEGLKGGVICTYIHRIMSAGWGFPVWTAAALIRAIRLRLTE